MTTPDTRNAPEQSRGFWLLLVFLIIAGAAVTGYEYWQSTQPQKPPAPKPAPPPVAPAPVVPPKDVELPASRTARIDQLVYDALMPPIKKTEKDVIADFGAPMRTLTKTVPNNYAPSKPDTLRTLVYPGLSVDFLTVTHTGGELPTGLTVTGKNWKVKWYLGVGTSAKTITDTLGEPKARTANTLTYEYSIAPSTVTFYLKDGVVTKVAWEYYVD